MTEELRAERHFKELAVAHARKLEAKISSAIEFGYHSCEKGWSLERTLAESRKLLSPLDITDDRFSGDRILNEWE